VGSRALAFRLFAAASKLDWRTTANDYDAAKGGIEAHHDVIGLTVVAASHFVEHPRPDGAMDVSLREMEVDDGREGESGAGALLALIKNRGNAVAVDDLIGERHEAGLVVPVSEIDSIRRGIERPAHGPCRGSASPC
jgi:hypothetical protein